MIKKDMIGVAFLGVGRMGETHLRNLAAISGIRVIAVADLVREKPNLELEAFFSAFARAPHPDA